MFRIPEWQMEALGQGSARGFVLRMANYLREDFPGETDLWTDDALLAWVERNVKRSCTYGIETEPEVAQYLLLALAIGEDAPERLGWFQEAVTLPRLIAPGKARALVRAAREQGVPELDRFVMTPFAT